jgi:hypothetical protein
MVRRQMWRTQTLGRALGTPVPNNTTQWKRVEGDRGASSNWRREEEEKTLCKHTDEHTQAHPTLAENPTAPAISTTPMHPWLGEQAGSEEGGHTPSTVATTACKLRAGQRTRKQTYRVVDGMPNGRAMGRCTRGQGCTAGLLGCQEHPCGERSTGAPTAQQGHGGHDAEGGP